MYTYYVYYSFNDLSEQTYIFTFISLTSIALNEVYLERFCLNVEKKHVCYI